MPNNIRQNPKCDSHYCTENSGEVREYPVKDDVLNLCLSCYQKQNLFRKATNRTLGNAPIGRYQIPRWQELKIVT